MFENRRDARGPLPATVPDRRSYCEHMLDAIACRCVRCGGVRLVTNPTNDLRPWFCVNCRAKERTA